VSKELLENTLEGPPSEHSTMDPSVLEANLAAPGLVIGRLYRVVRCLGLGRMGGVFLCEVLEEGVGEKLPLVAVKLLSRSIAKEGERNPLFGRFYREVEAIFRVAHPNVVSAFQFINHDGLIGYSMDYVPGGNLAAYLSERWPLEEWRVLGFLDHLSRGLEAIHEAGVVHRDLKPENILLTPDLIPKISDFGVAFCGLGSRLTANRALVGTIQYLSPEYLEKGVISPQGDVYALGVIAYELVTGAAPFGGLGFYEAIEAKVQGGAPDPRTADIQVSDELAAIIQRALSPRLQERFRSASEFNRAIRSVNAQLGRAKRTRQPTMTETVPVGEESDVARSGKATTRVRTIFISVAVLSALAVSVFFGQRQRKETEAVQGTIAEGGGVLMPTTYSVTRTIPKAILKEFKKEEDVYD